MIVNTTCPVTPGEAVDESITVEYEGRSLAFCCQRCRQKFIADPERYAANLPADGHDHDGHAAPTAAGEGEHEVHDHAAHREKTSLAGALHPVAVHFPIALVFALLLAEIVGGRKPSPTAAGAARFLRVIAPLSALVAVVLGFAAGGMNGLFEAPDSTLQFHRLAGLAAFVLITAACLAGHRWNAPARRGRRPVYLALLVAATFVTAYAGHLGGKLVFGDDYLILF
ncbi:YHS domain-containing protein [bacterium]|nr:YHS domain-containing protein [bacterium]